MLDILVHSGIQGLGRWMKLCQWVEEERTGRVATNTEPSCLQIRDIEHSSWLWLWARLLRHCLRIGRRAINVLVVKGSPLFV